MSSLVEYPKQNWHNPQTVPNRSFDCGFCGDRVSSTRGFKVGDNADGSGVQRGGVWICSNCLGPNFFTLAGARFPSPPFGSPVAHVPADLTALYDESRRCSSAGCHTAAVLVCRKMLMNIAVSQGAAEGLRFIEYVDYLAKQGFIPPNGKTWVDHIRKRGNEATHEIALMSESDARELVVFTEMFLKFIFEFPAMVPPAAKTP